MLIAYSSLTYCIIFSNFSFASLNISQNVTIIITINKLFLFRYLLTVRSILISSFNIYQFSVNQYFREILNMWWSNHTVLDRMSCVAKVTSSQIHSVVSATGQIFSNNNFMREADASL